MRFDFLFGHLRSRTARHWCALALLGGALTVVMPAVADGNVPTTGGGIYQAACASCHGADGRGAPPSLVGF
ncbi:MAG: c-type cytochrome [Thermoanaerobaculia bacterium]